MSAPGSLRRRAEIVAGILGDEFTADEIEDAMHADLEARYATQPCRCDCHEQEGECCNECADGGDDVHGGFSD